MNPCQGFKRNKVPCKLSVKRPEIYCRFHKPKEDNDCVCIGEKIRKDCSICLRLVHPGEDCGLICGHLHHIQCIIHVRKPNCPLCNKPLKFINGTDIEKVRMDFVMNLSLEPVNDDFKPDCDLLDDLFQGQKRTVFKYRNAIENGVINI